MTTRQPWQPKVAADPTFNPFGAPQGSKQPPLDAPEIQDAEEDTAPLQGSLDVGDDDSLQDVVADRYTTGRSRDQER